jgi:hypothetical protein
VDSDSYGRVMAHVWRLDSSGYPTTTVWDAVKKRAIHLLLHRMLTNAPAWMLVDHRYSNNLDCRRRMLRFANPSQNSANRHALLPDKHSRYRGVTLHKKTGKWQAQAKKADKFVHGGLHVTQEDAAAAYNTMARRLWGRFAVLNTLPRPPGARAA